MFGVKKPSCTCLYIGKNQSDIQICIVISSHYVGSGVEESVKPDTQKSKAAVQFSVKLSWHFDRIG
jgi:hypothetical protein